MVNFTSHCKWRLVILYLIVKNTLRMLSVVIKSLNQLQFLNFTHLINSWNIISIHFILNFPFYSIKNTFAIQFLNVMETLNEVSFISLSHFHCATNNVMAFSVSFCIRVVVNIWWKLSKEFSDAHENFWFQSQLQQQFHFFSFSSQNVWVCFFLVDLFDSHRLCVLQKTTRE